MTSAYGGTHFAPLLRYDHADYVQDNYTEKCTSWTVLGALAANHVSSGAVKHSASMKNLWSDNTYTRQQLLTQFHNIWHSRSTLSGVRITEPRVVNSAQKAWYAFRAPVSRAAR